MLFAAPLPPIWVPRTRSVSIGRSADCDIPVPSRKASRRHAEVRYEGDQVVVEDLGSTNGTTVNGIPVKGRTALRPGDRIDVGGLILTFCQVDSRFEMVHAGEKTVAADVGAVGAVGPASDALSGDLGEIPASVVLQILEGGSKSGELEITLPEGIARLWVEIGRPIHARTPEFIGLPAAYEVCGLTAGRFLFRVGRPPPARTLTGSMTELLLEASRRLDEAGHRHAVPGRSPRRTL